MPEPSLGEISVSDARRKMLEGLTALPLERVALTTALGRTLGEAVVALRDQPPFAVSAMDGYAVGPGAALGPYRLLGESAAGRPYEGTLGPAEAVRIFTGAAVPAGGRIIVQERAVRRDDGIYFEALGGGLDWIRPQGGDFKSGDTLLSPGVRLDPWRLALAAAAGKGAVLVSRRPRVAILSTGEEIIRAGGSPGPAQIFDSAGPALSALITAWGGVAAPLEPVGDDQEAIAAAAAAADCDLIVTVGGASVGDHDLTKPALRALGLELVVDTVRLRPGKPTWFGRLPDERRVLGLPGNPASALVCAELFLRPLVLAWQGADARLPLERLPLGAPLPPVGPREHWMRARLKAGEGEVEVLPFSDQDSSLVSVFAEADALVGRPAGEPAAATGERVAVLRLTRL